MGQGPNSRLLQSKGGFEEILCFYDERRGVNLKFCRMNFVHLIQKLCGNCSFKPKIPKNYNAFCSASESNKQNPRDMTLHFFFFLRYKHKTSLKNNLLARVWPTGFRAIFAALFVLITG